MDEDHLAFDAIKEVGPGGHYLMNPHTMKHLRTEYFEGNGVSHTGNRNNWEKDGSQDTWQRANAMAKNIVFGNALPKLDLEVEKIIREKFDIALNIN